RLCITLLSGKVVVCLFVFAPAYRSTNHLTPFAASLCPIILRPLLSVNHFDSAVTEVLIPDTLKSFRIRTCKKPAGWPPIIVNCPSAHLPCGILRPRHRLPSIGWLTLSARYHRMRLRSLLFGSLLSCFVASPLPAQLASGQADPLARGGAPAQACSATEASCAEAAAKIIPQVMGPSPLEGNLRRLTDEIGGRVSGAPEMAKAGGWVGAAFCAES